MSHHAYIDGHPLSWRFVPDSSDKIQFDADHIKSLCGEAPKYQTSSSAAPHISWTNPARAAEAIASSSLSLHDRTRLVAIIDHIAENAAGADATSKVQAAAEAAHQDTLKAFGAAKEPIAQVAPDKIERPSLLRHLIVNRHMIGKAS